MKRLLVPGLLLLTSNALLAGEAVISGTGSIQAEPDCVTLDISIESNCYVSPSEAGKAADAAAKNIYDFLKNTVDSSRDSVLSNGGYTQPYERYVDGKTVCSGTYQKKSSIQVNVRSVSDFAQYFDQIQEKVFAESKQQDETTNAPRVTITLGTPNPELLDQNRDSMALRARSQAVENALQRFKASVPDACKITSYSVSKISDPESRSYSGYAAPSAAGASRNSPVSFEAQTVTESVLLTIEFEGGDCVDKLAGC